MKFHTEFQQSSLAWMVARAGIPTASEFKNLVTPCWKQVESKKRMQYVYTKLAEAWLQGPLPGFSSWATESGQICEPRARDWLRFKHGWQISEPALITADFGGGHQIGCSPDGWKLTDDGHQDETGIEIKSPEMTNHIKYLCRGELPEEYRQQVQGSMYVTGTRQWHFLSYSSQLPKLLLTVERDEKAIKAIYEGLVRFWLDFESGWAHLCDLNGGPPPKREPLPKDASIARFDEEGVTP